MYASAAGANRGQIKTAGTTQPGILVANNCLRRQSLGFDSHAGQLSDRRADREDFDQARSEFDDVSLDAHDFLGADCGCLPLQALEHMLARIVDERRKITDLALHEAAESRLDTADCTEGVDRSRDQKFDRHVSELRHSPQLLTG